MTGTVLEEGLRGSGGYLLNGAHERFMAKYDPRNERATRDIVSRGIYAEMRAGNTTPMGGVYIQMGHLGPENVARQFPGMVKRCADCGFDLAGGLVEVVPTAHYMMGGVEFEVDAATAIPGLYAAGEDCGGAHGANRLGGNGVANSTVFGGIAGDSMAAAAVGIRSWAEPDEGVISRAIAMSEHPFSQPRGNIGDLRDRLWQVMWDDAGVLRTGAGLRRCLAALEGLASDLGGCGIGDDEHAFNPSWHDWLNLKSLIEVSRVIATAALGRENSRGSHYREDFPGSGDLEGSCYTRVTVVGERLDLTMVPVDFTIIRPGQSLIEGEAGAPRSAA
jgi:fumarate reductase flavoprotein subunit